MPFGLGHFPTVIPNDTGVSRFVLDSTGYIGFNGDMPESSRESQNGGGDVRVRVISDRMNRGASQQELADLIGVSIDVVRNLEATGNRPRWSNAKRVADFYGLRVTDFWPLDEQAEAA